MSEKIIATGLEFPEGPVWNKDRSLYVTEIRGGQIRKIAADGTTSVFARTGGGPNGAALGPEGALYVTNNGGFNWNNGMPIGPALDYEGGRIERIDKNGNIQRLYTACDGQQLSAPNDLVFDESGNFYFTDPIHRNPNLRETPGTPTKRQGNVYYASSDGKHIHRVATNLQHPNGIGLTPDGKTLIVAQTFVGNVIAFPILSPGRVGEQRLFGTLPAGAFPDSLCLDEEGYVLVAGILSGGTVVFAPDGKLDQVIPSEDKIVTNVAFGGPNFSTLYITESGLGRLVAREWARQGLVLFPDR